MTDRYFYEIPQFVYDRMALLEIASRRPVFAQHTGSRDDTKLIWDQLNCADSQHPAIVSILEMLQPEHMTGWFGFIKCIPGLYLDPHVDVGLRNCSLVFNVTPTDPAPIYFTDGVDGPTICECVYTVPTLINTRRYHAVMNDSRMRMNFQIGISTPFDDAVSMIKAGTFWSTCS